MKEYLFCVCGGGGGGGGEGLTSVLLVNLISNFEL